jgi:hypothetical protein
MDLDGTMLLELRSTGGQTVVPPSVHEGGEPIVWHTFETPARVAIGDLQTAVCEVAAVAMLARHWPARNSRQRAFMALSGGLLRGGFEVERAERFLDALAAVTNDEEARKRVKNVQQTAAKLEDDKKATGWTTLAALLGQDGKAVIDRVRSWLGITVPQAPAEPPIPEPPPWPDPPGEEAYHGLAGKIVRTIEPASEADPVAVLTQAMVAFGNIIGRGGALHRRRRPPPRERVRRRRRQDQQGAQGDQLGPRPPPARRSGRRVDQGADPERGFQRRGGYLGGARPDQKARADQRAGRGEV